MTAPGRRVAVLPTMVLLLGAAYCLFPVSWVVIAATKSPAELFNSFTLAPGGGLWQNLVDLNAYQSGVYWRWVANTAVYAGVGALLSAAVSGITG